MVGCVKRSVTHHLNGWLGVQQTGSAYLYDLTTGQTLHRSNGCLCCRYCIRSASLYYNTRRFATQRSEITALSAGLFRSPNRVSISGRSLALSRNLASGPSHNAANFERFKAQLAQEEILTSTPVGSALKGSGRFSPRTFGQKLDVDHRAAAFLQDSASQGRHFTVTGGDGVSRNLTQVPASVNGRSGIVEFLVGPKGLEHQRFIPGGRITGTVNQTPGVAP